MLYDGFYTWGKRWFMVDMTAATWLVNQPKSGGTTFHPPQCGFPSMIQLLGAPMVARKKLRKARMEKVDDAFQ